MSDYGMTLQVTDNNEAEKALGLSYIFDSSYKIPFSYPVDPYNYKLWCNLYPFIGNLLNVAEKEHRSAWCSNVDSIPPELDNRVLVFNNFNDAVQDDDVRIIYCSPNENITETLDFQNNIGNYKIIIPYSHSSWSDTPTARFSGNIIYYNDNPDNDAPLSFVNFKITNCGRLDISCLFHCEISNLHADSIYKDIKITNACYCKINDIINNVENGDIIIGLYGCECNNIQTVDSSINSGSIEILQNYSNPVSSSGSTFRTGNAGTGDNNQKGYNAGDIGISYGDFSDIQAGNGGNGGAGDYDNYRDGAMGGNGGAIYLSDGDFSDVTAGEGGVGGRGGDYTGNSDGTGGKGGFGGYGGEVYLSNGDFTNISAGDGGNGGAGGDYAGSGLGYGGDGGHGGVGADLEKESNAVCYSISAGNGGVGGTGGTGNLGDGSDGANGANGSIIDV